jgi:hypothetical protein
MELGLAFNMRYNTYMKFIKKSWSKLLLLTYILALPVSKIFAQTGTVTSTPSTSTCAKGTICNPLSTTKTLPTLIQDAVTGGVKIGIPIVSLAIIYCGFLFVFARGNPEKLTKAKDSLLWTLIGAAILLGSLAIAQMISTTMSAL